MNTTGNMTALAQEVRAFLIQKPKAAVIRLYTTEGDTQEIKTAKQSYKRIAETIVQLSVERIELYDDESGLLRAKRMDQVEQDAKEASETTPELPSGILGDPTAAMLTHFAGLIHQAYKHSTEIAFVKIIELVERMNDRADSIERRLERAESAHRRTLQDLTEAEMELAQERAAAEGAASGDSGQQMVSAFLSGQLNGSGRGPTVRKATTKGKEQ